MKATLSRRLSVIETEVNAEETRCFPIPDIGELDAEARGRAIEKLRLAYEWEAAAPARMAHILAIHYESPEDTPEDGIAWDKRADELMKAIRFQVSARR